MAFSDRFLDELAARCEISDIVSQYVTLTKKGNNLWGLCPFHNEKTPSFSVSIDKQIYHCFGCGKGGGVINFIMEAEQLSFPEAVRFLAEKVGMEIPDDRVESANQRARLLELNQAAARFFHQTLLSPEGQTALDYVRKRGISRGSITKFGLGAAPNRWDSLLTAMKAQGFETGELLEVGLVLRNKNGHVYDRFRNRLIFPIIDVRGKVIGFGGRILDDTQPKYLNSPESIVFHKNRNLFAMNIAKKSKQGRIILTEGYMDALSLHQAGFDCAVASLGTALTSEHAKLLSRYTKEVIIAYDSDSAGVTASQRAISILEKTGLSVKVLQMQGAKDPDEWIKRHGSESFALLLDRSENHIEYRLLQIRTKYHLDEPQQKVDFLKEAAQLVSSLPSAVEREVYGSRVAEMAGIAPDAVHLEVKRLYKARFKKAQKREMRKTLAPAAASQPNSRTLHYENVRSALAEEGVLRLLLLDESLFAHLDHLQPEEFSSPFLGRVYRLLLERHAAGAPSQLQFLTPYLTEEEMNQMATLLQKPESLASGGTIMKDYIETIRTQKLHRDIENAQDLLAVQQNYREKKGYGG